VNVTTPDAVQKSKPDMVHNPTPRFPKQKPISGYVLAFAVQLEMVSPDHQRIQQERYDEWCC
jgi:hypothetical protein